MTQPNVVIISTDQQRRDCIGSYGSEICQTPAIDQLSASGTTFDQAYTVSAICSPSRASTYTGLYPHKHGIMGNRDEFSENVRLVSQDLDEEGYQCGFIGKWHCGEEKLPQDFSFEGMNLPGYGDCKKTPEYLGYLEQNRLSPGDVKPCGSGYYENILLCGTSTATPSSSIPYFIAEETISMLEQMKNKKKPFLLFSNFWGPHPPYVPIEPFASMYKPEEIPPWGNFHDPLVKKPGAHKKFRDAFLGQGIQPWKWEKWAEWIAKYYGFVTMIDTQIGRIIKAIERLGLDENTIVVFTTDHGDLIGGHGGIFDKDSMMVQETYHIPLIIRLPGVLQPARLDHLVTNMDIVPTILELAGVDPGRQFDGRSLVPLLEGSKKAWRDEVYCVFNGHYTACQSRMLLTGNYKYVFNTADIDELYDLDRDPWELSNQIDHPDLQGLIANMRARMLVAAEEAEDPIRNSLYNLHGPGIRTPMQKITPWPGSWH
jgi:arylsulfatase A-like enzyme